MSFIYIPKSVDFIIDTLNKNNYEAFIVGGCVRDGIMNKSPKDFDITTSAKPMEIKKLFSKTIDTGIQHGTVTVVIDSVNYEVTTYRIDGNYNDCRRPEKVTFTNDLKEDLLRRDFTINAIAYHKNLGFIDPFNGILDINNKIIKGVGDPDKRFKEDALRILRCIRFSVQLGFSIEDNTYKALLNNIELIKNISVERIRDELEKLFLGEYLENIKYLFDSNVLKYINTDLYNYLQNNFYHNISFLKKCDLNIIDRLVIIFKDIDLKVLNNILKYLKFSNKEIKCIYTLVENINIDIYSEEYIIRKYMSKLGVDLFFRLLNLKQILGYNIENIKTIANNILKRKDPLTLKDLYINGNIIKSKNICSDKNIGKVLNYILDLVLKDTSLNNENTLINLCEEFCNNEKNKTF